MVTKSLTDIPNIKNVYCPKCGWGFKVSLDDESLRDSYKKTLLEEIKKDKEKLVKRIKMRDDVDKQRKQWKKKMPW